MHCIVSPTQSFTIWSSWIDRLVYVLVAVVAEAAAPLAAVPPVVGLVSFVFGMLAVRLGLAPIMTLNSW